MVAGNRIRGLLLASFLGSVLPPAAAKGDRVTGKQPNILFILADDLGWNDVGYHGSEIKTPNIDKLAAAGIKLENYYVQPICSPTRTQLLSGMYQIHTGLQHYIIWPPQPYGLPLKFPTIGDRLKGLGYATHAIGKWHAGFFKKEYTPTYRGFDSYFGYLTDHEDYYTRVHCFDIKDSVHNKTYNRCGYDFQEDDHVAWQYKGNYSTPMFAERATQVIKDHSTHSPDKPLFLYMPFQAAHTPIQAPQKYQDMYKFIKNKIRRTYAGMVTCLDDAIATVVDALKDHDMWDDTIVIFSTDNGGDSTWSMSGNNWPLRGGKVTLWEGGVRGVGWVSGPFLPRSGVSSMDLLHVSDWHPTLVRMAGGDTEGLNVDGHDAWDTLSKGSPSPRTEILHNIDPLSYLYGSVPDDVKGQHVEDHQKKYGTSFNTSVRAALRMGKWKLITGNPGQGHWTPPPTLDHPDPRHADVLPKDPAGKHLWLFDLEKDPLETTDLSDAYPAQVTLMLNRLSQYNATAVPVVYPDDDMASDPDRHGGAWVPWE